MSESTTTPTTPDQVFEIHSNEGPRVVGYDLRTAGGSASTNDLAEQTAAWQDDRSIGGVTAKQRTRVSGTSYRPHLQKLVGSKLREYDVDAGDVEPTENVDDVDEYLTTRRTATYQWNQNYPALALAPVAVALAVVGTLAAPVVGSWLLGWLAAGIVGGVLATAVIGYRSERTEEAGVPAELVPEDQ